MAHWFRNLEYRRQKSIWKMFLIFVVVVAQFVAVIRDDFKWKQLWKWLDHFVIACEKYLWMPYCECFLFANYNFFHEYNYYFGEIIEKVMSVCGDMVKAIRKSSKNNSICKLIGKHFVNQNYSLSKQMELAPKSQRTLVLSLWVFSVEN